MLYVDQTTENLIGTSIFGDAREFITAMFIFRPCVVISILYYLKIQSSL